MIEEQNFIILDENVNNCNFCNKKSQFYRYREDDYVCKEHLFGKSVKEVMEEKKHESNITNFYDRQKISRIINNISLKRKTFDEYKEMDKNQLLKSMNGFVANFDILRKKYADVQLENNFLTNV